MSLPLDVLLATPPTADDVVEEFRAELEALGIPARSWSSSGPSGTGGNPLNTILVVVATVYAAFAGIVMSLARSAYLDESADGELTALAKYTFGVTRRPATYASGQVRLDNAGGGVFSFGPGEFRAVNPTSKKAFVNVSAFTLGALETGKIVDVVAVEPGSGSSSAAGTITSLDTALLRVTCTNPLGVVGTDEESNESLRQACRDRRDAYGAGAPRGAYAYWARRATRLDGTLVDVNRVGISPSSSTGVVTVTVASPSGAPIAGDVTAVAAALETYVRPDSVTVVVQGATVRLVPVTATLWVDPTTSASSAAIIAAATTALQDLQATYPIGGVRKGDGTTNGLTADRIAATLIGSHRAIFDVDGLTTDTPLLQNEIPVFSIALTASLGVRP